MKIGIGLPNPVPNTKGGVLVEWAKRAEEAGFSGLVTIDRIAIPATTRLPRWRQPRERPSASR